MILIFLSTILILSSKVTRTYLPWLTGFTKPKGRSVFFKTALNLILINFKTNDFPFYKHENSDSSSSWGSELQGLEKTRSSLVRISRHRARTRSHPSREWVAPKRTKGTKMTAGSAGEDAAEPRRELSFVKPPRSDPEAHAAVRHQEA